MKIIDLSQKIYNEMPVHPYDEKATVIKDKNIEEDKYNNTTITLGMHVGTHIDAPTHLISDGKHISEYDLTKFCGEGCIIDALGCKEISLNKEYKAKIKNSEVVLVYTGYGQSFDTSEYYGDDAPVLSKEFAEYIANSYVKIVGMDLPSPDKYPFEIHKILLRNDVLIVENLTNIDKLLDVKSFTFCAMPLNIDAEASITRAIAIID